MSSALRYDRHVELTDASSVGIVSRWIKPGTKVLEFGPATGVMTRILSEQLGCEVTCVEVDAAFAELARPFAKKMIVGDLESLDLGRELEPASFDVVVFADVLEHLRNPLEALRRVKPFLKPEGELLVSIPNVSHSGVILELMQGEFKYRKEGLLDETHLRFFTRKSVAELLTGAGFAPQEWKRTILDPELSEFHTSAKRAPKPVRDLLTSSPDWNTYQFVVRSAASLGANVRPLLMPDLPQAAFTADSRTMQVFFDVGGGYSEERSVAKTIQALTRPQIVRFDSISMSGVHALRIDPIDTPGIFGLTNVELFDTHGKSVWLWNGEERGLEEVAVLENIEEVHFQGKSIFFARTDDPQIVIKEFSSQDWPLIRSLVLTIEVFPHQSVKEIVLTAKKLKQELEELTPLAEPGAELVRDLRERLAYNEGELHAIYASRSWKLTQPLRTWMDWARSQQVKSRLKSFVRRIVGATPAGRSYLATRALTPDERAYQDWMRKNTPSGAALEELTARSLAFDYKPVISIVLPVYEPRVAWLEDAIESVREQAYPYWELCIADDASQNPAVRNLIERHVKEDSRIKVCFRAENGHISESSNSALELATGEFVALLDHDDMLAPEALYEVVAELNRDRTIDMMYSNEDKIDCNGNRCQPTFKPQWSPDYFFSFMYIGHLSVYRRELIVEVGGFRRGFEGSQDYDLALRVVERVKNVRHLPKILYHWRMHEDSVAGNIHAKPYAFQSGFRALSDAAGRREDGCAIEKTTHPGIYRLRRGTSPITSLCVVITSGDRDLTVHDVGAITSKLPGDAYDLVLGGKIVSAGDTFTKSLVLSGDSFVAREAVWREALQSTKAEFVLLIDSRIRPESKQWIEEMLSQAARVGVVAVGPKIIDRDSGRILHAGFSIAGTRAASNFFGYPAGASGYAARLWCLNNVSAVSARCMMFRRSALPAHELLRQFCEGEVAQDIRLSRTLTQNGGRIVFTPYAEVSAEEKDFIKLVDFTCTARDLAVLKDQHDIGNFVDPYFPRGLDTKNVEFRFTSEG